MKLPSTCQLDSIATLVRGLNDVFYMQYSNIEVDNEKFNISSVITKQFCKKLAARAVLI